MAILTYIVKKMPNMKERLVAVLVYDGLCSFEFSCATELFGLARLGIDPDWYRLETCSPGGRSVVGNFGLKVKPDAALSRLKQASIVIVPGWHDIEGEVPRSIVKALRDAHARGATLASFCSGSFVLAATGLLDGRLATTHWRYAEALQRRYPAVRVDPSVLYLDEGGLMTSAGSAAALDLGLHLIRRDFGPEIANHVARRLVIAPHRDGGQAQFLERPVQRREQSGLSRVLEKMRQDLSSDRPLSYWASEAAVSQRTFIRQFKAVTGVTPGSWLASIRLDRAKELLESTSLSIDEIAGHCGFGTPATLRHHFRLRLGLTPSAYRKRFSRLVFG